jgi:peptidoglycan/xylan/chitin deacetylase (PgdA/CDA1 family)
MRGIYSAIRNFICGFVALLLTTAGFVRRAKRRALSGSVITAIYFHEPNRRVFSRCIKWLMNHGYTFISGSDLCEILRDGKPFPKGAVWLSFDDAGRELLQDVLPLIHEHRIPITLFIPTGIVEGDGRFPWLHAGNSPARRRNGASIPPSARNGSRDSMTVAEVKQVAAYREVTVGSHTISHPMMARCTEEDLRREISESKGTLESWTNVAVDCFSYPYGNFDGRERQHLIHFGYLLAATTENAFITPQVDRYRVPRFSVANNISFPEAVCNMVGIWRPFADALKKPSMD